MNYTIVGLFEDKNRTETAVNELEKANINRANIDVSGYKDEGEYQGAGYDYDRREENEGFWDWLFGSDDDRKERYSRTSSCAHVITVYADDATSAKRASEILDNAGAIDVDDHYDRHYGNATTSSTTHTSHNHEEGSIDVIKEDLDVSKKEVSDGGVRLKSRIIEKPVEEKVRLRNERVYVKRKPVNRKANEQDFKAFKEGTMEMKESHEEAVVNKEARVVEEVSLEKDVNTRKKTIRDTVRETEVEAEEIHS